MTSHFREVKHPEPPDLEKTGNTPEEENIQQIDLNRRPTTELIETVDWKYIKMVRYSTQVSSHSMEQNWEVFLASQSYKYTTHYQLRL